MSDGEHKKLNYKIERPKTLVVYVSLPESIRSDIDFLKALYEVLEEMDEIISFNLHVYRAQLSFPLEMSISLTDDAVDHLLKTAFARARTKADLRKN